MNDFKLEPGDILVTVNNRHDPISVIKRWALGSAFDHIFMYLGEVRIITSPEQHQTLRFPLLFESNGRGVVLQSLSNRYSQEIVVMRLKEGYRQGIPKVLKKAVKLASESQSYYDYLCIVRFAIPRLICEKLRVPMPLKYQRNPWQICSEACAEVFWRVKLEVLPRGIVPLPGDFVDSPLLWTAWTGVLSEELV